MQKGNDEVKRNERMRPFKIYFEIENIWTLLGGTYTADTHIRKVKQFWNASSYLSLVIWHCRKMTMMKLMSIANKNIFSVYIWKSCIPESVWSRTVQRVSGNWMLMPSPRIHSLSSRDGRHCLLHARCWQHWQQTASSAAINQQTACNYVTRLFLMTLTMTHGELNDDFSKNIGLENAGICMSNGNGEQLTNPTVRHFPSCILAPNNRFV